MRRWIKNSLWIVPEMMVLLLMMIFFADMRIATQSGWCFNNLEDIPQKKLALVLGTSKYQVKGGINNYYRNRIVAATELFHSGKIEFLLISGDNALKEYDEPTTMKRDLVKLGVPAERIFLDYAGFRTFDSVVRCISVFGEADVIIVSQRFHNERALYIARHKGLKAIGYNAADVDAAYGFKTMLRERLARIRTLLDVHVLNTSPRFLGDSIEIELLDKEEKDIMKQVN
jgi:SanA protein